MPVGPVPRKACAHNRQQGATLLEVLVSVLLVSFGVLALAGMQAYSVAAQKNAANRATAGALAAELAELIRLNPAGLAAGKYDVAMLTTSALPGVESCAFPDCTPASLADADRTGFQSRVRALLPRGGVELARPAGSATQADLWILWEEPVVFDNTRQAGGAGADPSAATRSAEIQSDNCPAGAKALPLLPRCFYMKVQL